MPSNEKQDERVTEGILPLVRQAFIAEKKPVKEVDTMKKTFWITCSMLLVIVMTGTFLISDVHVLAADQDRIQEQIQTKEQIYGSQLMTTQERAEYRDRMRNATTVEERERIRNEHHERMKERASEQGFSLPDEPRDRGMGRGMGTGGSMGRGGRNR